MNFHTDLITRIKMFQFHRSKPGFFFVSFSDYKDFIYVWEDKSVYKFQPYNAQEATAVGINI